MVQKVTSEQEFIDAINSGRLVVVDFYADWCGPCRAIAPFYTSLSEIEAYKDVIFLKVDSSDEQLSGICRHYKVNSLPTFMIFFSGENVGTIVGADKRKLEQSIKASVETVASLSKDLTEQETVAEQ